MEDTQWFYPGTAPGFRGYLAQQVPHSCFCYTPDRRVIAGRVPERWQGSAGMSVGGR